MTGRLIIFAALAAYLGVVGCIVFPSTGSGSAAARTDLDANPDAHVLTVPMEGLPYRGVAIQVHQIGDIAPYEKNIDEIAALGADAVEIVVDARQENGSSTMIFLDQRLTPNPEQLSRLIAYAKSKKLRVILMPIVLLHSPRGNEWRGTLKPESWEDWFVSYREIMKHYAIIAQGAGVDVLSVGSELVSAEGRTDQWTRTIRMVRNIYKGKLTYSANWDAYTRVTFWDQLDMVGLNSYYTLGDNSRVSVDEIVQRWRGIQRDLLSFQKRVGRPILFTEAGWCSLANAASEPWDYTKTSLPVDLELQRKLYEGFFRAWQGNPALGGFMMWEWPVGDGGPNDRSYTPENKPAQEVLQKWLAKPWK